MIWMHASKSFGKDTKVLAFHGVPTKVGGCWLNLGVMVSQMIWAQLFGHPMRQLVIHVAPLKQNLFV